MDYVGKIGLDNFIISIRVVWNPRLSLEKYFKFLIRTSSFLLFYLNYTPKLNRLLRGSFDVIFYNLSS